MATNRATPLGARQSISIAGQANQEHKKTIPTFPNKSDASAVSFESIDGWSRRTIANNINPSAANKTNQRTCAHSSRDGGVGVFDRWFVTPFGLEFINRPPSNVATAALCQAMAIPASWLQSFRRGSLQRYSRSFAPES